MTMPTLIYCAARQKRFAQIAMDAGYEYGAQLPGYVYFRPYFVDQKYREFNEAQSEERQRLYRAYRDAIAEHLPALATVPDLEDEDKLSEVLEWAEDIAQDVSEAVIIVPKVHGIISRLPRAIGGRQVRLGYSVPTSHGATEVMIGEFAGWPVHALGGSPREQMYIARYADVRSADGNYMQKPAKFGEILTATGRDYSLKGIPGSMYPAFAASCRNIRAAWEKMG